MKRSDLEMQVSLARFKPPTMARVLKGGKVLVLRSEDGRLFVHTGGPGWRVKCPLPATCKDQLGDDAVAMIVERGHLRHIVGGFTFDGRRLTGKSGSVKLTSRKKDKRGQPVQAMPWHEAFSSVPDDAMVKPTRWYNPSHHDDLAWAMGAACQNEYRLNLSGIMRMDDKPEHLTARLGNAPFFCTDGHRLHVVRATLGTSRLPLRSARILVSLGASHMEVSGDYARVLTTDGSLHVERVNHADAPKAGECMEDISRMPSINLTKGLISKIKGLGTAKGSRVLLTHDNGSMSVEYLSDDYRTFTSTIGSLAISKAKKGDVQAPSKWMVNARYLVEAGHGRLFLKGDDISQGILRQGPSRHAILMPMRT